MTVARFFLGIFLFSGAASAEVDFKKAFADRDACLVISDLETGKVIAEHNPERCKRRFTPCSSFKMAAALMAFEEGVFKDEDQTIKWDGIKRERPEEDRDQTPKTWMSDSVKWVTERAMARIGQKKILNFLERFNYGNKDFSGGLKDAWVSSSLKISAHEQMSFVSRLWKNELGLAETTTALTKKIIFIKNVDGAELYGKTGTGCLIGHACLRKPGKMIGSFVGILKSGRKTYAFAANASDLKDQERPAGPRLRNTTIEILKEMKLAAD